MRRYLVSGLLALSALTIGPATARADSSVAVLGIEPIDVPEALAGQLTDALRQRAAGTSGIRAVQGKDLIEIKMIFNCDGETPQCMANAGRSLGAEKLLYGTLKKADKRGANVVVALKLLDVRSAAVEKFVNETVSKRELAAEKVAGSAARWFGELVEVSKPTLTVTSDPTGAAVTVDGAPMGRTPVTLRDLNPGQHLLVVTTPGRMPFTRSVELKAGSAHEVIASLEAEHVAPPPVNPPPIMAQKPPEPAVLPPSTNPPPIIVEPVQPRPRHPGRTAKIIGLAALGGAVVTGGVAIYTWRTYSGLQDTAHNDLVPLRPAMPTTDQTSFFHSPNCNPSSSVLAPGAGTTTFKNDCSRGQSFADATTALWVVTGLLAAGGTASLIIGFQQQSRAERAPHEATIIKQSLRIAPVFSTASGGVQAQFEF